MFRTAGSAAYLLDTNAQAITPSAKEHEAKSPASESLK
jgi:hypothetical protein